jgi:NADH-quinone oxidoreductase subunit G
MATLNIEIDGKPLQIESGATLMDAASAAGIYIPHFCYHRKLSIAANCRMCLVQVEKAPKPLPACATPVTEGMKVFTRSKQAVDAQKGVMEFLLINHPLDCPICDQGGECQLQDLAVGYGGSNSRYAEPKRVVTEKELGPLVATDMTRCIHCSRCVRFGQEIAGIMELGMAHRGEHVEVMPFLESQIGSELSGNVIDLCPVGALTSKPFRYSARSWELSRRRGVSPHDGLGSNLQIQVKDGRVLRVLPLDNEAVNECWLSDRDRFSYQGVNSADRLTKPMIRDGDAWREAEWQEALQLVATKLAGMRDAHGADAIAALASPRQTVEELHLLRKLMLGLGTGNIDARPMQSDARLDGTRLGAEWLGMAVADMPSLDRILLVGSGIREEHPLLAHRMRQAVKRGAQLCVLHAADDDLLCRVQAKSIVAPSAWVKSLAGIAAALAQDAGQAFPESIAAAAGVTPTDAERAIAASLASGSRVAIFLGNAAQHHPRYAELRLLAQAIAAMTGAVHGVLSEAANSVGAQLVDATVADGLALLRAPRRAYVLLGLEPALDGYDPAAAQAALAQAEFVVSLSAYKISAYKTGMEHAHVLLPIAPFTETSGTFVNTEGRVQSFHAAARAQGESRPAWKALRVLGNLLGIGGFEFDSSQAVLAEALPDAADVSARLSNEVRGVSLDAPEHANGLDRLGEIPLYAIDPIVRRAPALQATPHATAPAARMCGAQLERLGLSAGVRVRVRQGAAEAELDVLRDEGVADGAVRVSGAHALTSGLAGLFDPIAVERL